MRVKVYVKSHQLDISCGDGHQTFQWLALVVQERLKQFNILRKSLEGENFLVTEIKNSAGELINPKDKIYEHHSNSGIAVYATLASSFPVDDWESPRYNDWMQVGYLHSKTSVNWSHEIEAWRNNLEPMKGFPHSQNDPLRGSVITQTTTTSPANLIKVGFDFSIEDVDMAFNLDWQGMKWKFVSMDEFMKSKVGDVIKCYYSLICNVFAHYAGIGKVGQRYGITLEEFGHLLHYTRVFEWKQHEEIIEDIFTRTFPVETKTEGSSSNPNSNSSSVMMGSSASMSKLASGRWTLMTRAHFVQALLASALHTNPSQAPDLAMKHMLEHVLLPFWETITTKYFVYSAPDEQVKQAVLEYYHLLKQVFHQYTTVDSKFGPRLSATSFLTMMKDATLLDSDQDSTGVICFLQAQLNPPVHLELEYLVFSEFVEAVNRLALKAIEVYSGLTDAKRIRIAINMLIDLPTGSDGK